VTPTSLSAQSSSIGGASSSVVHLGLRASGSSRAANGWHLLSSLFLNMGCGQHCDVSLQQAKIRTMPQSLFHIAEDVARELQYSPGTLRHQSRQKRYRTRQVRPCSAGGPKQLPHNLLAPFHISRVSGLFRFDHAVNLWKGKLVA